MKHTLIGLYKFDGPCLGEQLEEQAGIYAVLRYDGSKCEVVGLEEAKDLKKHWYKSALRSSANPIKSRFVAAYYMPGLSAGERKRVRAEIFREMQMQEQYAS